MKEGCHQSAQTGGALAHPGPEPKEKGTSNPLIAVPSWQPPTAWAASINCGTPAEGTSQTDGPKIASSLQPGSFSQPGRLPGDHPGKQMVGREEQETDLFIRSLDVRAERQLGADVGTGWAQLSEESWREVRSLTSVWSLGPGGLEGPHSRPQEGQEGGWGSWPLVCQPAACQG